MTIGTEKYIPASVGGMSLIGVGPQRPCSWGNYFWFMTGQRCLNMWAENLKSAVGLFLPDGQVKVIEYHDTSRTPDGYKFAIVIDERIPKDWLYNNLCFTGGYRPTKEIAEDIYGILGDPNNEMEWWTDKEMYHAKRCEEPIGDSAIRCYQRTEEKKQELIQNLLQKRARHRNG